VYSGLFDDLVVDQVLVQQIIVARHLADDLGRGRDTVNVVNGDRKRGRQFHGIADVDIAEQRAVFLVNDLNDADQGFLELHGDTQHLSRHESGLFVPAVVEFKIFADGLEFIGVIGIFYMQDVARCGAETGQAGVADRHDNLLQFRTGFDLRDEQIAFVVGHINGQALGAEERGNAVLDVNQDGVKIVGRMQLVNLVHQLLAIFELLVDDIGILLHRASCDWG